MVPGFNHNIMHKGRMYHIQTEDSGTKNPHIITHLFVGGNILATKKTSYADILNSDHLEEVVREIMEEQHKSMLRELKRGVYDPQEERAAAPAGVAAEVATAPIAALDSEVGLDEVILNYLAQEEGD
jgi:hypothetical protein